MRNSTLMVTTALAAPAIVHMSAYANNLTNLIPSLYQGLDTVSRELVGYIPSVSRSSNAERAALNQSVTYSVAPAAVAEDVVNQMTISTPPDKALSNGQMSITKSRKTSFGFNGEEQMGLDSGIGYDVVQADLFAQGLRVLTNEMEADLALEAYRNASRAYGTAGTTPLETGLKDLAQVRKILDDNGAPASGRSVVLDTSAGANVRANSQFSKVNEAGSMMTRTQGTLMETFNLSLKESAQAVQHTAGDAASATTNAAGYAKGATEITLASTGTGGVLVGDFVSFAGSTNQYMVVAGDADVSGGGTITIAAPGLVAPIPAAATAVTVAGDYSANVGFVQSAIHFATRAPAKPKEGDARVDEMVLIDPRSGIAFEVSLWAGERMMKYEVAAAWGQKAVKPEHIVTLLG